ncbi:MAG: hypothetical protein J0I41_10380 [Filimonas sp.]|nr:hypothetical protein [Filimonas sp.]
MKLKAIFFCAIILVSLSFKNEEKRPVNLYRMSGYYSDFYIKIDDSFAYQERRRYIGNGAYGMFIGRYWTSKNVIKVQLKVNGVDTVFKYDLTKCKCDSFMIGRADDFFVFLNEYHYPWFND